MRRAWILGLALGCGGKGGAPASPPPGVPDAAPMACDERYDHATPRAGAEVATTLGGWVIAARAGHEAPTDDVTVELVRAGLERRAPVDPAPEQAAELTALLAGLPCDPVWYAQPRFDIMPPMADDQEPHYATVEAAIAALDGADQVVATCGGCAVAAVAVIDDDGALRAIAWGPIP